MEKSVYLLSDERFINKVKTWLSLDGEIYVSYGYARSGAGNSEILIREIVEIEELINTFENRIGGIEVYRVPEFRLRGIANDELLDNALEIIPNDVHWLLFYMDSSNPNISIGCGDITHENLREAIEEFSGLEIALAYDSDFPPQEGQEYIFAHNMKNYKN